MAINKQLRDTISTYPVYLILLFVSLNLPLFSPAIQANTFVFYTFCATNLLLSILAVRTYDSAEFDTTPIALKRCIPIFIQGAVQLSVFYYIILMNPDYGYRSLMASRMPLILYQVLFAFVFEYLFTVSRGAVYRPGFYVMPMVFSINLFLWFVGNAAVWHLPLIMAGILIKTYAVRTDANGNSTHIYNPSFIVLTLCAIVIFTLNLPTNKYLYDVKITDLYESTPYFDIFVFSVGCITLWLPNSYLVAFGAYIAIMSINGLTEHFYGYVLFPGTARGTVMIAIMLAITDPKTTPHTKLGKFLFGISYGILAPFAGLLLIIWKGVYAGYYFKIVALPFLNYYSNKFDHLFKFKFPAILNGYFISRFLSIFIFSMVLYLTYETLQNSFHMPFFLQVVAEHIWKILGMSPRYAP